MGEDFSVDVSADLSTANIGDTITWSLTPKGGVPGYRVCVTTVWLYTEETGTQLIYDHYDPDTLQPIYMETLGEAAYFSYTPKMGGKIYIEWHAYDNEDHCISGFSSTVTVNDNAPPVTATLIPDKTAPLIGETVNWEITLSGGHPPYHVYYTINQILGKNEPEDVDISIGENEHFTIKQAAFFNGPMHFVIYLDDSLGNSLSFYDFDTVKVVDENGHCHKMGGTSFNASQHWYICALCSARFYYEDHAFWNGRCWTCNYDPADYPSTEPIPVDAAHFPDENFRMYLEENWGNELDAVESQLTYLNIRNKNIISLEGIAYFPNLQYLDCGSNQLTSLDVSANPALQELYCYSNQLIIIANNGQFDLSTLPGFDVTKTSDWNGGTVSGTILTVPASGDVTYTYDCGNGFVETFTLIFRLISNNHVLTLPAGLKTIEAEAFSGIAAEIVVVPNRCTHIYSGAFVNCPNLTEIIAPANCVIEDGACDDSVTITRR